MSGTRSTSRSGVHLIAVACIALAVALSSIVPTRAEENPPPPPPVPEATTEPAAVAPEPAPTLDPAALPVLPTFDPNVAPAPPAIEQPAEAPTAEIEIAATAEPTEPPRPRRRDDPLVHIVQVGETLNTLAAQSGFSASDLAQRNALTNPYLLLAGQEVRMPAQTSHAIQLYRVSAGDTLMSIAAQYNVSPFLLRQTNNLPCSTCLVFGQLLRVPQTGVASNLPEPFERVDISPALPRQGDVIVVRVTSRAPLQQIAGALADRPLRFAQKNGEYIALSGAAALQDPGVYPVTIRAIAESGVASAVHGRVQVGAGRFGFENLNISPTLSPLLEPQVNVDERAELDAIFDQFSGTQWWQGPLQWPVSGKIVSYYGTRRNFNRGKLNTFHSGVDLTARVGTPIMAAAPGRVAAVQPFKIRGNVVVLDHGRGVFTIYCHLSKFNVQVGQIVNAGDVIGYSGNTGRSLGPHLHWELAVGGVTVNPLAWIDEALP